MVGTRRRGHFDEVAGDGFALAALFGSYAGIGSGEIEEGEDGAVEFFGDAHGAEGFAVALRLGRAELAGDTLFEGAALEVADDEDRLSVEEGHAAAHRRVIAEGAVAVNLAEIGKECFDEVHGIGALRVPGQLGSNPGLGWRRCRGRFAGRLVCHKIAYSVYWYGGRDAIDDQAQRRHGSV